jgi:hypothetical protein
MKHYPPITKKEFRELCELSSGPIEVGSALNARADAALFDATKKSDKKKPAPLAEKKPARRKAVRPVRLLKKHSRGRLSAGKPTPTKTRRHTSGGHHPIIKKSGFINF